MDEEVIRKQAKKILDDFAKTLDKVKFKEVEFKKEVGGFRNETNIVQTDGEFRKIMFENAPKVEDDCIVAETKKW